VRTKRINTLWSNWPWLSSSGSSSSVTCTSEHLERTPLPYVAVRALSLSISSSLGVRLELRSLSQQYHSLPEVGLVKHLSRERHQLLRVSTVVSMVVGLAKI
jgi:hypothetical protein